MQRFANRDAANISVLGPFYQLWYVVLSCIPCASCSLAIAQLQGGFCAVRTAELRWDTEDGIEFGATPRSPSFALASRHRYVLIVPYTDSTLEMAGTLGAKSAWHHFTSRNTYSRDTLPRRTLLPLHKLGGFLPLRVAQVQSYVDLFSPASSSIHLLMRFYTLRSRHRQTPTSRNPDTKTRVQPSR